MHLMDVLLHYKNKAFHFQDNYNNCFRSPKFHIFQSISIFYHLSLSLEDFSREFQVFGVGIPNPYRLRPYLGARVPVNTSFAPLINMHNPHSSTLQVS